MRLPALDVIACCLQVTYGFAKMCLDYAVRAQCAHGQLGDLVIKINKAFNNHATVADPATGHRIVPGFFDVIRPGDLALALAG
jgi:hypothetical protein